MFSQEHKIFCIIYRSFSFLKFCMQVLDSTFNEILKEYTVYNKIEIHSPDQSLEANRWLLMDRHPPHILPCSRYQVWRIDFRAHFSM